VFQHTIPRFLPGSREKKGRYKVCKDCDMKRAGKEHAQYLAYNVSQNKKFYESFLQSLYEIEALALTPLIDEGLRASLDKLLFLNVITAMETYLSDAFINTIMGDDALIRKLVETNPDFKNRKIDLSEIYSRVDGLKEEVRNYLLEIIYHNIAKVKPMYESVLNISFPNDLSAVFKAIQVRHDIAHRSGKTKEGAQVSINKDVILKLIAVVQSFVEVINKQLPAHEQEGS
jgi:hypothetical protein